MLCSRCQFNQLFERRLNLEKYNIFGNIYRIDCNICTDFLAVKIDGKIIDIDSICYDRLLNGWKKIETNRERLIHYILSQIIYLEFDIPRLEQLESPFDLPDEFDIAVLRWINGKSIGFYTVKPKGEKYTMPVLDTAYVRSNYRNQGYGLEILYDIVARFPSQDVGFSKPISKGMLKVLKKFLTMHKEYRLRFWEIADCDVGGSQQLIWCRVRH